MISFFILYRNAMKCLAHKIVKSSNNNLRSYVSPDPPAAKEMEMKKD